MKVKVCPKCGKHNSANAWNCTDCGETLSVNTLMEVDSASSESNKGQTTDAELYERGRSHYKREEYGAAIKDFQEAIRLRPDNANYYGWLAHSYRRTKDNQKALEFANKALGIDSRCVSALSARGSVCYDKKEYEKSLKDFDLACQIEPNNARTYYNRAFAYHALNDIEKYIADVIRYNALSQEFIEKHSSSNAGWQQKHTSWYETIFQHLKQTALPQLANEEKFIAYYPVWFSWDLGKSIYTGHDYEGRAKVSTVGNVGYGAGYIYLTDSNLYVQLFGDLSLKYQHPLFLKPSVLGGLFGMSDTSVGYGGSGGQSHYDRRERGNVNWRIPFSSASSVKASKEKFKNIISIVSSQLSCQILPHFDDQYQSIITTIQMGISGKLSQIVSSMNKETPKQSEPVGASNQDVFQVLKQLSELKDKGVITETEFENKKKELLARL